MTQLSNWHFEECEKEGCTNGAVVGFSNGNIHVCSVCAALPEFSRMKPSVLPRRLTSRLLAVEGQEPVRNPVLAYADSYREMANRGVESVPIWSFITDLERNIAPLFTTQPAPASQHPELTVWYGSMPETNGKSNWTAILHRKGEGIQDGISIDRAEYPGRVLYAADRVRYLIGEKPDRPCILDYDGDKHSGYVKSVSQHDELPMGYLQGHKDGLEWAARLAEANHPQTGDWLYDDPLELAKAIRKGPDMPTAPVQAWIPCSERMPPEATMVLGRCDNDYDFVNLLGGHLKIFCMGEWRILPGAEITHWMPLPAAPQEPGK